MQRSFFSKIRKIKHVTKTILFTVNDLGDSNQNGNENNDEQQIRENKTNINPPNSEEIIAMAFTEPLTRIAVALSNGKVRILLN